MVLETSVFTRILMERRSKAVRLMVELMKQTPRFGTFDDGYLRGVAEHLYDVESEKAGG